MKTIFHFAVIFSVAAFVSCSSDQKEKTAETPGKSPLEDFEFMQGKWQMDAGEVFIFEEWTKENDSTFNGHSWMSPKDSLTKIIPLETVILSSRKGKISYNPVVKNQNGGQSVEFVFTGKKGNDFVFENPMHDNPQRIAYRPAPDSLIARTEGKKDGKDLIDLFPYCRKK